MLSDFVFQSFSGLNSISHPAQCFSGEVCFLESPLIIARHLSTEGMLICTVRKSFWDFSPLCTCGFKSLFRLTEWDEAYLHWLHMCCKILAYYTLNPYKVHDNLILKLILGSLRLFSKFSSNIRNWLIHGGQWQRFEETVCNRRQPHGGTAKVVILQISWLSSFC